MPSVKPKSRNPLCNVLLFSHKCARLLLPCISLRTEAALDAHFKTPHMATWRSHWPAFGVSDRRLFAYEIASERQL